MSFRGAPRGGRGGGDRGGRGGFSSRGAPGGRGGFSSRGGGRGGFGGYNDGPPDEVVEIGTFIHAVEGEMLCASTMPSKVPYFNAPIYLPTKANIGKVDEILGPINEVYFTIKPANGILATSFTAGDKVCIGTDKLLPIERFLPQPKVAVVKRGKGRGGAAGGRGGARGRGAPRGGRGAPRGAPRGGRSLFQPAPAPPTALGRHRILSPTCGLRVSPLQLGAMSIGSAWEGFMGSMNKEQSFALLDAFVAAGGNFIDTANNYQNEESEKWIGEWMTERKNRDRMVIATKYTTHYRSYVDGQDAAINSSGNNKRSMMMSTRDSLAKLQTDWIDILYLHWWDWSTSIEEVMDALHILVVQGKVLYLGISDTPAWIVSAANTYAKANGKTQFCIYQGRWNVMLRDFEREIIPMARQFGMALAPWDALGGGRLQSKKAMAARQASGETIRTMLGGPEQSEREIKVSAVLEKIANEHKVESVTTIALAYVMSKTTHVFPLVGGRKIEHLQENIKALEIKLTDAQIKEIEDIEPFSPGFPHDFVGEDPAVTGKPGGFMLPTVGTIDYVQGPKPIVTLRDEGSSGAVEPGLHKPRPRQRRGADAKKEEKKAKREREEQDARAKEAAEKRARHRKTEMAWDSLDVASSSAAPIDPDALPEVEPDTKAYFREVASKIQEMEDLGHGRPHEVAEGEDEVEDDRPYLLRSALESLSGHEIPLAGDGETSLILEKLLYSMDDFARRVLADRFAGNYNKLVKHRAASHVLQTLFTLAGETVDRETRGIIATSPTPSSSDAELPTMTALLLSALSEILPSLPTLIYDPFGSHTLRVLLLVFSGSPPATEGRASAERSKKSLTWRKAQGPMKSFLAEPADDASTSAIAAGKKREVPPPFADALVSMWESLIGLDEGGPKGEGVRRAAMDAVAGPAVRIMLEMEATEEGGWRAGGWADRIMCGLVEEVENPDSATEARTELRGEFLGGLLRHPASSPTFESLLMRGSDTIFSRLWGDVFKGKLHRLAGNAVANFVVAVGMARLDAGMLKETIEEIRAVGTERRGEWIDNYRTGVLKSLVDRCAALGVCEKDVNEILLDTFQLNKVEDHKLVVSCVLSLNRLEHFKKLPDHVTAQAQTQGSILLQSWLKLASPHQLPVITSLSSLGFAGIQPLTQSATSSRVIDAFLSSPTTPPSALRKFIMSLIGHYHTLADDRIGSRVVERCWAVADVYLKDKIAASLVEHQTFLQQSSYGHFFARKVELPLWERGREKWKLKMAAALVRDKEGAAKAPEQPEPPREEEKKKRARPVDEVDEIFAGGRKGNKTGAGGDGPARTVKVPRVEGFEDVFKALKATTV